MLTLAAPARELRNFPRESGGSIMRVSAQRDRAVSLREREVFLVDGGEVPPGFGAYIVADVTSQSGISFPPGTKVVVLASDFVCLEDGDVIRIRPRSNDVRVLYRRNSPHNHFLTTERCNHYCLMCSQPPKAIDDSWIITEILEMIPLIDPATREIGFTGGEPTLLGQDLFRILRSAKTHLPNTAIHILSNGRRFADVFFAEAYAAIDHSDMMIGIPLYSDVSTIHDYVVQADNAFDETIRGILNLKRLNQRVEIRIVVHQQTYKRLPKLAKFIARNLTFVDQVALMGLEITGFTRANLGALWIDPVDYQTELYQATTTLADHRMKVSIYNHQLCLLDKRLWPYARKSISDWKNEYMPECDGCAERNNCGGFFSSAKIKYSKHIRPFI